MIIRTNPKGCPGVSWTLHPKFTVTPARAMWCIYRHGCKSAPPTALATHYKSIIVQKVVMSNTFYDDADVPLTAPLLNMIIKRDWTRKDGNIHMPSLLHAMEGFSPFTMIDLSKDGVVGLVVVVAFIAVIGTKRSGPWGRLLPIDANAVFGVKARKYL